MMEFIDLAAQQQRIKSEIDANIQKVLTHGKYILGPEVAELEEKLETTIDQLRDKYGYISVQKASVLLENSRVIARSKLVGGHSAGGLWLVPPAGVHSLADPGRLGNGDSDSCGAAGVWAVAVHEPVHGSLVLWRRHAPVDHQ